MNVIELDPNDVQLFLTTFADNPTLSAYLNSPPWIGPDGTSISLHSPPYGVIVLGTDGQTKWLAWFDASNQFHVIDMTAEPAIADQIAKIDYHTADESLIYNLTQQVNNFYHNIALPAGLWLAFAGLLVLGWFYLPRRG